MIETFRVKLVVWWRLNVSGQLRLGEFLRFVLREPLKS